MGNANASLWERWLPGETVEGESPQQPIDEVPEPKEAVPKRKKWVEATEGIKKLIAAGESFESERILVDRLGFTQKVIETAFKKSEELQEWRQGKLETAPPVERLNEVHLDSVAAPPAEEEPTSEEVELALAEIRKAAEPAERERIGTMGEAERRQLAAIYLDREWGTDRDERKDYATRRL